MTNVTAASVALPGASAPAPGNQPDAARIRSAIDQLRATESGRQVADFLATSHVQVRVVPDAAFHGEYPGAGAIYDPKTRLITVPHGALATPQLVTTLAHEGQHALDFADRPAWALQALQLVGGSAADGARSLVRLRNPLTGWLDGLTARQNEDEVRAYALQANVARELGRNESAWALGQARDGTPLPIDEVRTNVATNHLYRMSPGQRLELGAGLGVAATSVAALGAQSLASHLRPGSFLGQHAWPAYALVGVMAAGWLVGDQLRANRLERYDAPVAR